MVKIGVVVIVFTNIISLTYGDLSGGVASVITGINDATGNLLPTVSKLTLSANLQSFYLPGIGNTGTIGVPFDTICKTPGVNDYIFCYLCNQDCYVIHNRFGGKCGARSPTPGNPSKFTCLCADSVEEAKSRNISTSSEHTCKGYLLPELPYSLATLNDELVRTILETRLRLLECPKSQNGTFSSSACNTDCQANHGFSGGYCGKTTPRVKKHGTAKRTHCECNGK